MSMMRPGTTVAASTKPAGGACARAAWEVLITTAAASSGMANDGGFDRRASPLLFPIRCSPSPLRAGARIHLDRHMRQTGQAFKAPLVGRRRLREIGHDRGHHRRVAGPKLPYVQVGHPVAAGLDALANGLRQRRIGNGVE